MSVPKGIVNRLKAARPRTPPRKPAISIKRVDMQILISLIFFAVSHQIGAIKKVLLCGIGAAPKTALKNAATPPNKRAAVARHGKPVNAVAITCVRKLLFMDGGAGTPDPADQKSKAMRRCGDAAMRRCGDAAMRRCGDAAMRRCGDAAIKTLILYCIMLLNSLKFIELSVKAQYLFFRLICMTCQPCLRHWCKWIWYWRVKPGDRSCDRTRFLPAYGVWDKIGGLLAHSIYNSTNSWSLMALPLFILMGELLYRTAISDKLFNGLLPGFQGSRDASFTSMYLPVPSLAPYPGRVPPQRPPSAR